MPSRVFAAVAATVLAGTLLGAAAPASAATHAHTFKNCTDMHKTYPHGVGKVGAHDHVKGNSKPVTDFKRSNALYAANKKSDRDKDGIACEAH